MITNTSATNINHINLVLSLPNSLEDNARLLDVNAQFSLDVLSGRIEVKYLALYLVDEKANSQQRTWTSH